MKFYSLNTIKHTSFSPRVSLSKYVTESMEQQQVSVVIVIDLNQDDLQKEANKQLVYFFCNVKNDTVAIEGH